MLEKLEKKTKNFRHSTTLKLAEHRGDYTYRRSVFTGDPRIPFIALLIQIYTEVSWKK